MGAREQFDLKLNCFLRRIGLSRVPRSVVVVLLIVCVGIVGFGIWRFWPSGSGASEDFEVSLAEEAAADTSEEEGTAEEAVGVAVETVTVDVGGAVKRPGVYVLDASDRIDDALDAAGGTKKDAAVSVINRALALEDGAQIYVPTKKQVRSGRYRKLLADGTIASFGSVTAATPQTAGSSSAGSSTGSASASSSGSSSAADDAGTLININTADESELQQLSGIGEVLSAQIVSYRETNGNFSSIEDIKNVSGIGDARFAAIADSICV